MTATKTNGEDKMKKATITFERVPNVGKHADEWTIRANDREAGCLFRDNKTGDWFWLAGFSDDAGYKLSANTHIDLPSGIPVHAAKRLVRDALQNTGNVVHHTGRFNERGDEIVVAIITAREGSGPAVCALTNDETPALVHFQRPAVDKFAGEDVERDESIREMDTEACVRVADKGLAASRSWISEDDASDRDFVRPTETETETCTDCDEDALRLDTTTGAVDCVDCGNETETMNAAPIDIDRQHSTSLTTQIQAHVMGWDGFKGYANKATAARALKRHTAQLADDGLGAHFALVQIPRGHRHAGRLIPTLGWEAGAMVSQSISYWIHVGGFLIFTHR